jgi:hypothetical protein
MTSSSPVEQYLGMRSVSLGILSPNQGLIATDVNPIITGVNAWANDMAAVINVFSSTNSFTSPLTFSANVIVANTTSQQLLFCWFKSAF